MSRLLICCCLVVAVTLALHPQHADASRELLGGDSWPPYIGERSWNASNFYVLPNITVTPDGTRNKVCFTIKTKDCCTKVVTCSKATEFKCCATGYVAKFDLWVNPKCRNTISQGTLNGIPTLTPTFEKWGTKSQFGRIKTLLKNHTATMYLTKANATGAQVCLWLGGACPTLASLKPDGATLPFVYGLPDADPHKCVPMPPST